MRNKKIKCIAKEEDMENKQAIFFKKKTLENWKKYRNGIGSDEMKQEVKNKR